MYAENTGGCSVLGVPEMIMPTGSCGAALEFEAFIISLLIVADAGVVRRERLAARPMWLQTDAMKSTDDAIDASCGSPCVAGL
ncbi:MAG TPA: hypothetical protein VFT29_06290 [Gemmatimonadaceae bacterium]|nr:hypothetical protein [Gemmatimonadaceae bacterium]